MNFLVNILFALIAFFLVRWFCDQMTFPAPVGVCLGLVFAIVVFFANFAARLVQ